MECKFEITNRLLVEDKELSADLDKETIQRVVKIIETEINRQMFGPTPPPTTFLVIAPGGKMYNVTPTIRS